MIDAHDVTTNTTNTTNTTQPLAEPSFLYAVGGQDALDVDQLLNVEVFDGTSWSAGPDLTAARYAFGLASS